MNENSPKGHLAPSSHHLAPHCRASTPLPTAFGCPSPKHSAVLSRAVGTRLTRAFPQAVSKPAGRSIWLPTRSALPPHVNIYSPDHDSSHCQFRDAQRGGACGSLSSAFQPVPNCGLRPPDEYWQFPLCRPFCLHQQYNLSPRIRALGFLSSAHLVCPAYTNVVPPCMVVFGTFSWGQLAVSKVFDAQGFQNTFLTRCHGCCLSSCGA